MKSIYTKLFFLFTVIGIIPLLAGSFYYYSRSHHEVLNKALREQDVEVSTGNRNIVSFFIVLSTAHSLTAQKSEFIDYFDEPEKREHHKLRQERALRALLSLFPGSMESAGFAGKDGRLISLSGKEGLLSSPHDNASIAEKEFFMRALNIPEGMVYCGKPEYSMVSQSLIIYCASPAFNATKKLSGVLYTAVRLGSITASIRNVAHYEDIVMIVDHHGRLIGHNMEALKDTLPPAYTPHDHTSYRAVILKMMMGADGSERIVYRDRYHYITYRNIPSDVYNQNKWSLGIITSEDTIYGTLSFERYMLFLFPAFGILIAVAIILGWRISHPIKDLTSATMAMSRGKLNTRVVHRRKDEIGQLAMAFNDMAHAIQSSHDELLRLSTTDGLTGLYNHREFQKRLEEEIDRAERHGHVLCMLMIDIDNFKNFNDTYGHQFGDTVLHLIGEAILNQARNIDVAARYGGEEMAVILPETDPHDAYILAERIRTYIEELEIVVQEGEHTKVTVSIGISSYPEDAPDREGLIDVTDQALYIAKEDGRNRTIIYGETIKASFERRPTEFQLLLQKAEDWIFNDLVMATEARIPFARGHSRTSTQLSIKIAESLQLSHEETKDLRLASMLHDIGTLSIPADLLKKMEPLTNEEWKIIRSHPEHGEELLGNVFNMTGVLPAIRHHHEHYDGTGYPEGMRGAEIPLLARIISVVDAYCAMTVVTPYRKRKSQEEAIGELRRNSGTQFDPLIVEVFIDLLEKGDKKVDPHLFVFNKE